MFKKTIHRFRTLRPSVRALVFLFWMYVFVGALTNIFTQVLIYERYASVALNVIAMMIFFTGIMIGFCVYGFFASLLRLNIKHGFMWSFVVMGAAMIYILNSHTTGMTYVAMLLNGIGQGLFWLTIHTYELAETKDHERDFYSSLLSSGEQVLGLVGPACATALIWLSGHVLHWGNFTLLFLVAPLTYLLGIWCFSGLRDYRPQPIEWRDVRHFLFDTKNIAAQPYLMSNGFQATLGSTIIPLSVLFILGGALEVGFFNTFFAVVSSLFLLVVAHYRTPDNRMLILGIALVALAFCMAWFGYVFTFVALLVYSAVSSVLTPMIRVSLHVIDLQTMESIGRPNTDFFATMIFRDVSLWFWRMMGGVVFLVMIAHFTTTEKNVLVTGLYTEAIVMIYALLSARYLLGKDKRALLS